MSQHQDSPYPDRKNETGSSTATPGAPPTHDGTPYTTVYTQPIYTQPLPGYQQPHPYIPRYYGTPVEVSPGFFDMEDYRTNWDSATTGAFIVFLMGILVPFIWCFGFFFIGPGHTRTTRTFGYAAITALMIYAILGLIIGITAAIHNS